MHAKITNDEITSIGIVYHEIAMLKVKSFMQNIEKETFFSLALEPTTKPSKVNNSKKTVKQSSSKKVKSKESST